MKLEVDVTNHTLSSLGDSLLPSNPALSSPPHPPLDFEGLDCEASNRKKIKNALPLHAGEPVFTGTTGWNRSPLIIKL